MEIDVRQPLDLAAAVRAIADRPSAELTLNELVRACALACLDESDLRLRKWTAAFGNESAWAITPEQLEVAAQAMVNAGYKPSTANRDLSSLGSVYRWAKQRRLSPRGFRSPTLDVERFGEDIRRVEVSATELDALRARALAFRDRRFGVFVGLLIDTGARKSELLERRWAEVDLVRREIECPTTKTGIPRILHFRPETAQLIERICKVRPDRDLVFPGQREDEPISYRGAWTRAVADIGRPDLHMHDIRHARAASLLRSGTTIAVAAQVMGHSPAVLARRYGHLEVKDMRIAQERSWSASE